ncbi:protoporphyrinogen oxidase [Aestuariirhabdus sp. LZHN29]|uniref:protoporphyrinogen oxidase n=1 Tax=Aestuariirhabdus sp. LZHN29 TaxID=3417462 RepID=UPI003CEAFD95
MQPLDLLIIGGGISGLSSAWWLHHLGLSMELWESGAEPGGKIASRREAGYLCEQGASMIVNHRPEVERLITECGAGLTRLQRPARVNATRYLLEQERLLPLRPTLPGMARSSLISWRGKLRMLAEPLLPRGNSATESVADFIRRRMGPELLDRALDPFVSGTLANDPEQACARSILPRLTALETEYGSILLGALWKRLQGQRTPVGQPSFSFLEGMQTLPRVLAQALEARPGQLRYHHRALLVERCARGWRVTASTPDGERTVECRQLMLCCPATVSAQLLKSSAAELSHLLTGIEYAPITLVHTGFASENINHPLDSQGFLTPSKSTLSINGCLWPSSIFSNRAPTGHHLLTSYLGGSRRPQAVDWDHKTSLQAVLDDLDQLLGIGADPDYVSLVRHPQGLPRYPLGHHQRYQRIQQLCQQQPGLSLNGNYLEGVSVRERIAASYRLAGRVIHTIKEHPSRSLQVPVDLRVAIP